MQLLSLVCGFEVLLLTLVQLSTFFSSLLRESIYFFLCGVSNHNAVLLAPCQHSEACKYGVEPEFDDSIRYTVLAAWALSVQTLNFVLVTIVNHDSRSLMVTTQKSADFRFTVVLSTIVCVCVSSFAKVVVFLAML